MTLFTYELPDTRLDIEDHDGYLKVGQYTFSKHSDLQVLLEDGLEYVRALTVARDFLTLRQQNADELRTAEAARVLLMACDERVTVDHDARIPDLFLKQAKAILAAIDEGLV